MTTYRTTETNIDWHNLESWAAALYALGKRPGSSKRSRQIDNHLHALPTTLVYACDERDTLIEARDLVVDRQFGARPPRRLRANAPHTPIIVAINNRLYQLSSVRRKHVSRSMVRRRAIPDQGASAKA